MDLISVLANLCTIIEFITSLIRWFKDRNTEK